MRTIIKVYKKDCKPCQELSAVLAEVSKEIEFKLEEYDITSVEFKERKIGKGYLTKYAATIPFILFAEESGEQYAAHYYESGPATSDIIISKLEQ